MNLEEAAFLSRELMNLHKLDAWNFGFKEVYGRLGMCDGDAHLIELSIPYVVANDWARVKLTVLHEIAHALVGCREGHNWKWQRMCAQIGGVPARIATVEDGIVTKLTYKMTATCPTCGKQWHTNKRKWGAKCHCGALLVWTYNSL